jgi:DNA modification methylase
MGSNRLYYGDNLDILRDRSSFPDESVDLIYLDPPFNSNRSYNVLFKSKTGDEAQAQVEAFDDTWTWSQQAEALYNSMVQGAAPVKVAEALEAMRRLLGDNDVLAYIVMMTGRLVELRRVLKDTGSLYLHCDPTASHYLKLILDSIFGPVNFKNEIIWRRTGSHGKVKRFGPIHDVILFYTKTGTYTWNYPKKRYMKGHVEEYFVEDETGWKTAYYGNVLTGSGTRNGESGKPWMGIDPTAKGRHWAIPGALVDDLDEDLSGMSQHEKLDRLYELGFIKITKGDAWPMYERYVKPEDGPPVSDLWTYQPYTQGTVFGTGEGIDEDVRWLATRDAERLGYPTQKPVALLERIIRASSNPGDLVLDPFCGCGTTVDAAQKLGRRWVGIDVTYLAVDLIDKRLWATYGDQVAETYKVHGIPQDLDGARALFAASPFDFERWAVSLVDGQPNQKQVGDKGIDGVIRFPTDNKGGTGRSLVSVKGGATINPGMVRDLVGTLEQQRADMGVFICLAEPTKGIREVEKASGVYSWSIDGRTFPKVQIITVAELLAGQRPNMPTPFLPYVQAQRLVDDRQMRLGI